MTVTLGDPEPGHSLARNLRHQRTVDSAPRTARGQRTRHRLLEAAEAVFGDLGFHATSIADITRHAHVAQGTFYLYFDSKLGVFVELFEQMGHDLRSQLRIATANVPDRLSVETAGLAAFLAYAVEHPRLYRIAREAEFVVPVHWQEWYDKLIEPYAAGLEAAIQTGQIRHLEPKVMACALIGLADFVGLQILVRRQMRTVPTEVVRTLSEFIAFGLVVPADDLILAPASRQMNRLS